MSYGRFLSLFTALTLCLVTSAQALPVASDDRAELFATCSGRLEALAARQRARMDAEAASVANLQEEFDLLLETVLPWALSEGIDAQQPKRWRIRGWVEVAYLLADMDYSFDARIAENAERLLNRRIAECREVVL